MKNFFNAFIIIFILSFFILPKLSFANVVLVVDPFMLPTAVTLHSAGLTPNQEVVFKIVGIEIGILTTSDSSGLASADFSDLIPNHQYTGNIFYKNNLSLVLAQVTFNTPSAGSSAKSITDFAFFGFDPAVVGVIDEASKMIALTVPAGTNVTALTPTILVSPNATVNPHSGIPKDFTNGVTYTVTAEDGTTQNYTAVVFVENNIPGDITVNVRDITETSATILGTNFPKNKEISFNVENYDSSTPSYTNPQDYMTDDTGIVLLQFYGLSPGGHYKYSQSEATGTGSFWTTGNAPIGGNSGEGSSVSGEGGLVPCGTKRSPVVIENGKETGGEIENPCEEDGVKYLMDMINNVIDFILFKMAIPIAAIMFAYAGFLLVFSGGESSKRTKAKSIFINVAIGLVLVAASWLIVHTILSIVGYDQSWNWFGL